MYRYSLLLLRVASPSVHRFSQISTGKNATFLSIHLSDLHHRVSDSFGLRFDLQAHPLGSALSASCSSDQRFTAGFLQIRSHQRHHCLWLTLPTIKACSGLPPYSLRTCRAHMKNGDEFFTHRHSYMIKILRLF